MLGTCLGVTSPPVVISLVVLSLGLLLLLWPKGETRLFSATRSTCARYQTTFLELCALVYIMCAAISLFARFQARNFGSNCMLVLLGEQAITSIWKIDLIACAAIVVSHLTGHHDICDRIHRRVSWFGKQLQRFTGSLCDFLLQMVQEPDLERQSIGQCVGVLGFPAKCQGMKKRQGHTSSSLFDGSDQPTLQERLRYLRSLSMSPASYTIMHQELGSISAQLRWTAVRYRYIYNRLPIQDFFSLAASRVSSIKAGKEEMAAVGPMLQLPPRSRRTSTGGHSPSFSSVVTDAVKMKKALGSQDPPSPARTQQLDVPNASQSSTLPTPVFQLPGTIETICVKALPDTGSSQNVIDKNIVQSLFPSIPMEAVNESTDKLLVAPDGQPIPCIGKIFLSWIFKDESEKHHRWFYVVENCSNGVIIGNGFLRQTQTMSKHRHRLELTTPSDPNSPPPHLLSEGVNEARQDECLRQLVRGRVNNIKTVASLDTGCEANLMSTDYAKSLGLTILPLPTNEQHVRYADGRRDFMLGQVGVDWSFVDTPNKATKVIFYVLQKCIHPVIFGQRFIFFEDPWYNHATALTDSASEPVTIGVVALAKGRRLWGLLRGYKPDPQEEAQQREKKARNDRVDALLQTQQRAQAGTQPQQQTQTQAPAVPQPAVVANSNQPASP